MLLPEDCNMSFWALSPHLNYLLLIGEGVMSGRSQEHYKFNITALTLWNKDVSNFEKKHNLKSVLPKTWSNGWILPQ